MVNYYLSPNGSDSNSGVITSPWFSLQKAWSVLLPGDILYLRGGTYTYTKQQYLVGRNGTSGNLIKIHSYPGELPIITRGTTFDKSAGWHKGMVFMKANFIHIKGIRFTGMYTDDDQVDAGLFMMDVNNSIFEQIECDNNVQGIYIEGNYTGNLFLNSDFHDNYSNYGGSNGGNSDGLGLSYNTNTSANNTVRGCRSWNNGDDGFDTFENSGYVLIDSCWSWHNGFQKGTTIKAGNGVGFKLGSDFLTTPANVGVVKRRLQNCIAWDNGHVDEGGGAAGAHINEADHSCEIYNCTFYKNGVRGINFHYNNRKHYFKNVVCFGNGNIDVEVNGNSISSNCSYTNTGSSDAVSGWINNVTADDFVSLTPSGVSGPRKSDGGLPDITFLKLKAGSDLINTGVNVGLPYIGPAPDRGAFEYVDSITSTTTTTTTTTTTLPVSTSTTTTTTTLPVSTSTTTTTTTTLPSKVIKTANNNLSTKKLVITFIDGTTRTINNSTKPIKTVSTDYVTKKVTVTYIDGSVMII